MRALSDEAAEQRERRDGQDCQDNNDDDGHQHDEPGDVPAAHYRARHMGHGIIFTPPRRGVSRRLIQART